MGSEDFFNNNLTVTDSATDFLVIQEMMGEFYIDSFFEDAHIDIPILVKNGRKLLIL